MVAEATRAAGKIKGVREPVGAYLDQRGVAPVSVAVEVASRVPGGHADAPTDSTTHAPREGRTYMAGSDLFTGTLDLIILRLLVGKSRHGYAIGKMISEASNGMLAVEEGALYPALHRLEKRGLLESDWGKTDTGRRAKFYSVTPDGWGHLEVEAKRWAEYSVAVSSILGRGIS